jgi:cytoskeletal protein CcmA (bactofilin family)
VHCTPLKMIKIVNNQSNFSKATPDKLSIINRQGTALLVVLFIVMAITVLSLGFLSRSDVELACGQNMLLRTQMDCLAESGLEHTKGLILNPQDIGLESGIWQATGQQLDSESSDYYDVTVNRDPNDSCNYNIDCNSYRQKGNETIGRSSLIAELRLDPCIVYWVGTDTTVSERITINGDVYCDGSLYNSGIIDGDVFAAGNIAGTNIQGLLSEDLTAGPVDWPSVQLSDFIWGPYYIGSDAYWGEYISDYHHPAGNFTPSTSNPAGVRYRGGLGLQGDVNIEGTLVLGSGGLIVKGTNNVIISTKNFPALIVDGDLKIYSGSLQINGLAIIDGEILLGSNSTQLTVTGALFVRDGISELAMESSGNFWYAKLHYSPTWHPDGGPDGSGAIEFDGNDDYAQTPDSSTKLQLVNDYTLCVWIKPDPVQKSWAGIFSKTNSDGSINHWTLQFDTSTPRQLIVHHPDGGWNTGIKLNEIAGSWHHVAIIRSGDLMSAYIDGDPRNSGTWECAPDNGYGHLNIGADRTASADYVYQGLIDDIRIYDQANDPNEIYPPASTMQGLIGYYRFDGIGALVSITADPATSAIEVWPSPDVRQRWSQTAGAFFRSIKRQ